MSYSKPVVVGGALAAYTATDKLISNAKTTSGVVDKMEDAPKAVILSEPESLGERCMKVLVVDYGWIWPMACGFLTNTVIDGALKAAGEMVGLDSTVTAGLSQGVANVVGTGASMLTNKGVNTLKGNYIKNHTKQ
jgi:hypothetical protein